MALGRPHPLQKKRPLRVERAQVCAATDCERTDRITKGWCGKHYQRWVKYGDPTATKVIVGDTEARFWSKVARSGDGECWLWTSKKCGEYGRFFVDRNHRNVPAHRYSYELVHGQIPAGHHIDHLCVNPPCVNPAHLEAVTPAENNRRSQSPTAMNARKTHCAHGHEFTEENTQRRGESRECRTCAAESQRRYRSKRRVAA